MQRILNNRRLLDGVAYVTVVFLGLLAVLSGYINPLSFFLGYIYACSVVWLISLREVDKTLEAIAELRAELVRLSVKETPNE